MIFILFLSITSMAYADSVFDNGVWHQGSTHVHIWKHAPYNAQGKTYDYSIEFSEPDLGEGGGDGSTDYCSIASENRLVCPFMKITLIYNAGGRSVTLRNGFSGCTTTYY